MASRATAQFPRNMRPAQRADAIHTGLGLGWSIREIAMWLQVSESTIRRDIRTWLPSAVIPAADRWTAGPDAYRSMR